MMEEQGAKERSLPHWKNICFNLRQHLQTWRTLLLSSYTLELVLILIPQDMPRRGHAATSSLVVCSILVLTFYITETK
jgi:hypothetical protein